MSPLCVAAKRSWRDVLSRLMRVRQMHAVDVPFGRSATGFLFADKA